MDLRNHDCVQIINFICSELRDFTVFSKVPVESSLAGREPKTRSGATKKTCRDPPKKVSFLKENQIFGRNMIFYLLLTPK